MAVKIKERVPDVWLEGELMFAPPEQPRMPPSPNPDD